MNDIGILHRIEKLHIEGFRGFIGKVDPFDTDADLVLLLGPNGTGKTSFLEALQLVLTGVPISRERGGRPTDDWASLFSLDVPPPSPPEETQRKKRIEIRAQVKVQTQGQTSRANARSCEVLVHGLRDSAAQDAFGSGSVTLRHSLRPACSMNGEALIYPVDPVPEMKVAQQESVVPHTSGVPRALPDDHDYAPANVPEGASLHARLTSFFQHDVGRLFDDASEGRTVLDLAAPRPVRIRHLLALLQEARDKVGTEREKVKKEEPPPARDDDVSELGKYRVTLDLLLLELDPIDPVAVLVSNTKGATELNQAVLRLFEAWGERPARPEDIPSRLKAEIERRASRWRAKLEEGARSSASDETVRGWQRRLDEIVRALDDLHSRRPNLEQETRAFLGQDVHIEPSELPLWGTLLAVPGTPIDATEAGRSAARERVSMRLPGLLPTLVSLKEGLTRWIGEADQNLGPRPEELRQELRAVRLDALAAFVADLRIWTEQIEEDRRRLKDLQSERTELERRVRERTETDETLRRFNEIVTIASRVPSEAWKRLLAREQWQAEAPARQRRLGALSAIEQDIDHCVRRLATQSTEGSPVLEQLTNAINEVIGRFCISGQPTVDVKLEETEVTETAPGGERAKTRLSGRAKLVYNDGRGLAEFSSGQCSQMAVAFLVAQNLLVAQAQSPLDRGMPHRVLLLDDVSSTYDLTNLVRESILWRQLAYTDNPQLKRQVFLSSHHEDLTNLLIDHLVPPAGHTMRVLRFTGWAPQGGPIVDSFRVEPGRSHDDASAQNAFRRQMEVLLHGA